MTDNSSCGRRYDREFKQSAAALVRGGKSISQFSRDLGVSQRSVGRLILPRKRGHVGVRG